MSRRIVVDKAGATIGGARRFLIELEDHLQRNPRPDVELIGGDNLTSRWLIEREFKAVGAERIALNNASFAAPGRRRTVLLRNAIHFASEEEFKALGYTPSEHMRKQIPVIRALAHRANRIVVPCTAMGERVVEHCPKLADRIEVRMHPVSPRGWAGMTPTPVVADDLRVAADSGSASGAIGKRIILTPIVPQTYKRLGHHVPALLQATEGTDAVVAVTASPGQIPEADGHPRYLPIGVMPAEDLARWWGRATAIFFPPTLESFGYALAEARCGGRPVIAPDTGQTREIAGPALRGYEREGDSLADAARAALDQPTTPDPEPFDPDRYFEWLFS